MPSRPPRNSGTSSTNALAAELGDRIRAAGPMTFAEFMRAALYHPIHGYYTCGRPVWGEDADYVTAPQVHPAYGGAVARLAAEVDEVLGKPERFDLVELGGGEGRLLQTALEALRPRYPDLWERTRAGLVEPGAPTRARARRRLPAPGLGLWDAGGLGRVEQGDGRALRGLVVCNELLDAFPVERIRRRDGRLEQAWVDVVAGELVERFRAPASDAVRHHLEDSAIILEEGQVAEVCLEVGPWLDRVAAVLAAGALLVIDYGHETATLYGPERRRGTLVTMHRFQLGDDPLADPGRRDLTAHVDLGSLRRLAHARGLSVEGPCSLRVFLLGMGAAEEAPGGTRERLALRHLLVSEIGDAHKAMLLSRGLPPGRPVFGRRRLESRPA